MADLRLADEDSTGPGRELRIGPEHQARWLAPVGLLTAPSPGFARQLRLKFGNIVDDLPAASGYRAKRLLSSI